MSRYGQYSNYYDPVGSQQNQRTGYTYQNPAQAGGSGYQNTPAASNSYNSANYQGYGDGFNDQQYNASGRQPANSSTTHAAAALSSLHGHSYNQPGAASTASAANTTCSGNRYDNSTWPNSTANTYGSNPLAAAVPNRSQSSTSPLYAGTQTSNTFGNMSGQDQSQAPSNAYASGARGYQVPANSSLGGSGYQSGFDQQQTQPPRYSSPVHAVQAQQNGHRQRVSKSSNHLPSPQMTAAQQLANVGQSALPNRQQTASVEPSPTTVDPSQVYDNRAELQRKAQIEAERRRKYEADQAAKKAEEDRLAEEKRKQEEQEKAVRDEAARQAKNEQKRKAREEKKQSKNAATALQRLSSSAAGESSLAPPANDEEAEMREMFRKMREFNAKNPAMLAKLWDEERKSHEAGKTPPTTSSSAPPPQQTAPNTGSPNAAPAQAKGTPSTKAAKPPKAAKSSAATKSQTSQQSTPQRSIPPQSTPQSLPASGQAAQTSASLWPPNKKGALADVTAKWLTSLPQNASKSITADNVRTILDRTPSYVQLCEAIETYDMSFDRSALARELLKATPDNPKPQPASKAAIPLAGVDANAAQAPAAPTTSVPSTKKMGKQRQEDAPRHETASNMTLRTPMSLSDVAREVNTMHKPAYPPPSSYAGGPVQSPYFPPASAAPNAAGPVLHAASPVAASPVEVKPELKPEEPPRPPANKEEAARKRTFGDLVDLTQGDSDDEDGPPPKKIMVPAASAPQSQHRDPLPYLAKPMNFGQYVFPGDRQRQPSQVAPRPIQIPGRQRPHGPAPPVNMQPNHNGPMHNTLPSQQAPAAPHPPPQTKGPTAEQLQTSRMRGKMLVEPIMRDRAARKSRYDSRTIARDVLLAAGRHPDMRGLNTHFSVMQKLLGKHGAELEGGNYADLSTIRWDLIDPEPAAAEVKSGDRLKSKGNVAVVNGAAGPSSRADSSALPPNSPPLLPPKKARGRPPKNRDLPEAQRLSMTNPAAADSNYAQSSNTTSRPTTPASAPGTLNMTDQALGYASFAQVGPDGKKKKGRPFGWRASIHSRAARGLPPASSSLRAKSHQTSSTKKSQEPVYHIYKCDWEGCKSELHNLETLKKHVVKVHGRKTDDLLCEWEGCEEDTHFDNVEPWLKHIDEVHFAPIKWKLGDGPAIGDPSSYFETDDMPSYLLDANGRAVTPVISPSPSSSSAPQSRIHKGSTPMVSLDDELARLEKEQRMVGPTMGRMGCVLANTQRRATFLDDEDFVGRVTESEGEGGW